MTLPDPHTQHQRLLGLIEQFRPFAPDQYQRPHYQGLGFPLPIEHALRFADHLAELGVPILGADGWTYVDNDPAKPMEVLGVHFAVSDIVLRSTDAPKYSARQVKRWIRTALLPYIRLVEFTFILPKEGLDARVEQDTM